MTHSQITSAPIIMTVICEGRSLHINNDMITASLKKLTNESKPKHTHDPLLTHRVA